MIRMENLCDASGDARDFCNAAGDLDKKFKCGRLPRDAGNLVGLSERKSFF